MGAPRYPATGLVLLSLDGGSVRATAPVGTDPVAVTVSGDGRAAYVADSSPGDVYAVRLPELTVTWKAHLGGEPFGLLLSSGRLFVSLFDSARVVELDPSSGAQLAIHAVAQGPAVMTLDAAGHVAVASHAGFVDTLGGTESTAGAGYGIALAGSTLWTADYARSRLVRAGAADSSGSVALPLAVFPFWIAPGLGGTLLVAAEGANEDADPGAVLSYDPMNGSFQTLARPRDPDQVIQSGSTVLVVAHGDRDVLAIHNGATSIWAQGAAAVAVAPDPALGLLVVAVNANE